MDRGNRTFDVASTLLAPAWLALAMLVLSDQAGFAQTAETDAAITLPPAAVVQADLAEPSGIGFDSDGGEIQLVAGKQTTRTTSHPGGLLQRLTAQGASSQTTRQHPQPSQQATHNHSPSQSTGLLRGLFGESSSNGHSGGDSSTGKSKAEYRVVTPLPNDTREPADWSGVPFHQAKPAQISANSAPIRDPGSVRSTTPAVRDGGSGSIRTASRPVSNSSSTASSTGSTRRALPAPIQNFDGEEQPRSSAPVETSISSRTAVAKPVPKSTVATRDESNDLSSISSSRRSDRRSVDALDASEIAAAARPTESLSEKAAPSMSAPKVARREIPSAVSVAKEKSGTEEKIAATKPLPAPQSAPLPAPPSAPLSATLAAPKAVAKPIAAAPYKTPANPTELSTEENEPLGSIPAVPYAASTPDLRSPTPTTPEIPNGGFQPRGTVVSSRNPAAGAVAPFRTASSAPAADKLLSVPHGEIASLSRDAGERIAQVPVEPLAAPKLEPLRSSTATQSISETPTLPEPIVPMTAAPAKPVVAKADAPAKVTETAKSDDSTRPGDSTRALEPNQSTVATELPGIRVATFGPTQIMIRQSHPYEIRIENRGAIDATGVVVRANIPSWAEVQGSSASRGDVEASAQSGQVERLVWKIDQLPAGATERMFVRLKAVRSGSHDMDVDWTLAPQKSVSKVYVQEPKIAIVIDGPDEVVYGQSRTYKVRISNPGDGVAPNVMFTLSPNSATPQTQRIGDIPAGKEAQIEIELTAQDLGNLSINGLAAGDLELRAEGTKTIRVAAAKLQASLNGPQVKYQNTESIYHLEIKNAGTATSENVAASLRLPVGVKYLGGLELAEQRADMLTWKLDSLAPGEVREYQFKCNMTATGDQMFSFDCKGTAAGQADVAIATRVEAIADLVLAVNDPPAPAPVNEEVTYEIVIRNRGSKEARDVRAVAQFSNGIEPQRIEGQTGELLTGQVIFEAIPQIAPGEQIVLRVIAKAETDGHHRFRTEVTAADTVLVAEEATHFMSAQTDRVSRHSEDKVRK